MAAPVINCVVTQLNPWRYQFDLTGTTADAPVTAYWLGHYGAQYAGHPVPRWFTTVTPPNSFAGTAFTRWTAPRVEAQDLVFTQTTPGIIEVDYRLWATRMQQNGVLQLNAVVAAGTGGGTTSSASTGRVLIPALNVGAWIHPMGILHTVRPHINGGTTWHASTTPTAQTDLYLRRFVISEDGYKLLGTPEVMTNLQVGRIWPGLDGVLYAFLDGPNLSRRQLHRSLDNGQTWELVTMAGTTPVLPQGTIVTSSPVHCDVCAVPGGGAQYMGIFGTTSLSVRGIRCLDSVHWTKAASGGSSLSGDKLGRALPLYQVAASVTNATNGAREPIRCFYRAGSIHVFDGRTLMLRCPVGGTTWEAHTVDAWAGEYPAVADSVQLPGGDWLAVGVIKSGGAWQLRSQYSGDGITWPPTGGTLITSMAELDAITVVARNSEVIVTNGHDLFWRSLDSGGSWTEIPAAPEP